MSSSVTELFMEVDRWATPILKQTLEFYLSQGEKLLGLELDPKEYKKQAAFCIKAAKKELEFAKRLALFKDSMGEVWGKAKTLIDCILRGCTFKLGNYFIEKLPELTKGLSVAFSARRSEIALEILEQLAELSGEVGKEELSKSEINKVIKKLGCVPESGESVKILEEGKVQRAEILGADAGEDVLHLAIEGGIEKTIPRGSKIIKPRKLPKIGEFCAIAEGSQTGTTGFVENFDSGIATVRCMPIGDTIEIELRKLDKISATEAAATESFLRVLERAQTAEDALSKMTEESPPQTELAIPAIAKTEDLETIPVPAQDSSPNLLTIDSIVKVSENYSGTPEFKGKTAKLLGVYNDGSLCHLEFDREIETAAGFRSTAKIATQWLSLEAESNRKVLAEVGF